MLPDKTIEYDDTGAPKLTLKRTNGLFDIVIEVDGIAPYRGTTAEERQVGIESLNPPTVHAKNTEQLLRSGSRAVQAAIFASPGSESFGPGDLAMIHYRTTRAVRDALRSMGEDV
jgi:hypothetical protein